MREARRAHASIMPGAGIRQGLIPDPIRHHPDVRRPLPLPPPLTGGAREGQMAWRRWSGIEGPHVQPPPHYPAYPMAACQVSYARPSLCLAPLLITPLPTSPLPLPISTRARRQDLVGRRPWREGSKASACQHHAGGRHTSGPHSRPHPPSSRRQAPSTTAYLHPSPAARERGRWRGVGGRGLKGHMSSHLHTTPHTPWQHARCHTLGHPSV